MGSARVGLIFAGLLGLGLGPLGCGPSASEVKKRQEEARFHYDLAYGYFLEQKISQIEAALHEITISLKLDPENPDAHLLAGLIHLGRKRNLKAAEHFQQALALKPDHHFARNNLGATYLALERWDDAIVQFERLVEDMLYSKPGHAQNNLGWAWYQKGDQRKAYRHFATAIEVAPQLCPPYNNLGMLLLDQREPERALKYLDRGLSRCPHYTEAHLHRGRALVGLRRLAEATQAFESCVRIGGESTLAERCEAHLSSLRAEGSP